jgi:hypothetical protein
VQGWPLQELQELCWAFSCYELHLFVLLLALQCLLLLRVCGSGVAGALQ